MSKGAKPAGNTTTTTTNPVQQAQTPFLQNLWDQVGGLGQTNPVQYFPGQTLADYSPFQTGAYSQMGGFGQGAANATAGSATSAQANALNSANSIFGQGNTATGQISQLDNNAILAKQAGDAGGVHLGTDAANAVNTGGQYGGLLSGVAQQAPGAASPMEQALMANSGMAIAGNPALRSLMGEANGQYLNSNPALSSMVDAASRPVVNAYQTATAPQSDSGFESGGRYGSGAIANRTSVNEQNLGKTLGDMSANIYGTDYANERGLQTQAGGLLSTGFNQGVANANTGFSNAGQLANTGIANELSGLQAGGNMALSGINSGITADTGAVNSELAGLANSNSAYGTGGSLSSSGYAPTLASMGLAPSLSGMTGTDLSTMLAGGTGTTGVSQSQIQDLMNRFYGNQQAPWQTLNQESNLFGNPIQGSSSTTTPFFQNGIANALGTLTGGLGLANGIGGSGGIFGGSGGLGGLFSPASSFATDAAGAAVPLGSLSAVDAGGSAAGALGGLGKAAKAAAL